MIPLAVPNLGELERAYIVQAIKSGWVGPSGPFVEQFEDDVAKAAGRSWAIATITGSAALHVTFSSFSSPGYWVGIFKKAFPAVRNICDILSIHTAVYPTGKNHDICYYPINEEFRIADRAPAIGEHRSDAQVECYSFAANKIVTCGHGGAIVGDDPYIEKRLREEIHQGYGLSGHFNYRMANINAAIGCAQMERLDELKVAKRHIWQRYADAGLPMVERGASRWMATIAAPGDIIAALRDNGIEARAEPSGVSIPCSTHLNEHEQDKVIKTCKNLLSL